MTRELEIDIAYTLLAQREVAAVWALDSLEDGYRYAVEMSPYSVPEMVAAHFTLLGVAGRDALGAVLYFDSERPPPFVDKRGNRLRIKDHEWFGARRREQLREERRDGSEDDTRAAEVTRFLSLVTSETGLSGPPPAAVSESGVFRVVLIEADPFPSPRRAPARILVLDDRQSTEESLTLVPRTIDVVLSADGWTALERVKREHFDLIVCAVRFGDWSGRDFVRMACRERPDVATRILYLSDASPTHTDSARARVLTRPLDPTLLTTLGEEARLARRTPPS